MSDEQGKRNGGWVKEKKIEIILETYERLILKREVGNRQIWCATCKESVLAWKPEEAAVVKGISARTIYRWVEAERLHFTESSDGLLLICFNSLLNTN
ncbi:MAG: hypothetical protein HY231_05135 [Acidobacteria bacterium]|nr:hypothetical protein [Acidobacteriota bacterium]